MGGGGVTTRPGEEDWTSAKAQLGDTDEFIWLSLLGEYALACVEIKMNSPITITSKASKLKRFSEKKCIVPPRISLVLEPRDKIPEYCDNRHL
jgi:hypothetical protein